MIEKKNVKRFSLVGKNHREDKENCIKEKKKKKKQNCFLMRLQGNKTYFYQLQHLLITTKNK